MSISIQELRKLEPTSTDYEKLGIKIKQPKKSKNFYLLGGTEDSGYWTISCSINRKGGVADRGAHFMLQTKDESRLHSCKYYNDNREERLQYSRGYYEENKECFKEYNKQYNIENKEKLSEQHNQYHRDNPDKVHKWFAKYKRELGYEEILPAQWGCVMHHVDDTRVIPIPEVVHQQLSGMPREEHRALVDEWMREVRPDLWLLVHL